MSDSALHPDDPASAEAELDPEQIAELERRVRLLDAHPEGTVPWREGLARLDRKYG
jgi:hypothetical protein